MIYGPPLATALVEWVVELSEIKNRVPFQFASSKSLPTYYAL